MIKKYKKRLLYILTSIIAIILIGLAAKQVIAKVTLSSEESFLNPKADDLIGSNMNTSFQDRLQKYGKAACFYHAQDEGKKKNYNSGINGIINSNSGSYDIIE